MTVPLWSAQISPAVAAALAVAAAHAEAELHETAEPTRIAAAVADRAPVAFATVIEAIEERLARSPRFAIVRGLPVAATALLIAISARLGTLVDPYCRSTRPREIRPATDREHDGRALNTLLHTDSTDWPVPNDLTCLWCVRPDPEGGGRSLLLTADDFVAHVEGTAGAEAAALLSTPLPWRIASELGGGVYHAPIATGGEVRWMRYTVEPTKLPPDAVALLAQIERVIERAAGVIDVMLDAGDLLVIDNRHALHGRTPAAPASSRLLLRTKLRRAR